MYMYMHILSNLQLCGAVTWSLSIRVESCPVSSLAEQVLHTLQTVDCGCFMEGSGLSVCTLVRRKDVQYNSAGGDDTHMYI